MQRARGLHAGEFHPHLGGRADGLLVIGRLRTQHILAGRQRHGEAQRLQRRIAPRAVRGRAIGREAFAIVEKGHVAQAAAGVLRFQRDLERIGARGLAVGRALQHHEGRLLERGLDVHGQAQLLRDLRRGPALGQHLLHDVGPVVGVVELAGGGKVRLLVRAAVRVAADEALAALGAGEETVPAPQHPALAVGVGEEGEQLATLVLDIRPSPHRRQLPIRAERAGVELPFIPVPDGHAQGPQQRPFAPLFQRPEPRRLVVAARQRHPPLRIRGDAPDLGRVHPRLDAQDRRTRRLGGGQGGGGKGGRVS